MIDNQTLLWMALWGVIVVGSIGVSGAVSLGTALLYWWMAKHS